MALGLLFSRLSHTSTFLEAWSFCTGNRPGIKIQYTFPPTGQSCFAAVGFWNFLGAECSAFSSTCQLFPTTRSEPL